MQISLLSRTLQKQNTAARLALEDKLKSSEEKVASLSAELSTMKKKLESETKAREEAEKQKSTAQKTLSDARRNERHLQKEQAKAVQKAVGSFLHLVTGVRGETEAPEQDGSVLDAIRWLGDGLDTFGDLLEVGREYSALEALRAFTKELMGSGCEHVGQVQPASASAYWKIDKNAHASAMQFFDTFWRGGGRDLSLYRAALAGKVCTDILRLWRSSLCGIMPHPEYATTFRPFLLLSYFVCRAPRRSEPSRIG